MSFTHLLNASGPSGTGTPGAWVITGLPGDPYYSSFPRGFSVSLSGGVITVSGPDFLGPDPTGEFEYGVTIYDAGGHGYGATSILPNDQPGDYLTPNATPAALPSRNVTMTLAGTITIYNGATFVSIEWYDVSGGGFVHLGSGQTLTVPLATGHHDLQAIETDSNGRYSVWNTSCDVGNLNPTAVFVVTGADYDGVTNTYTASDANVPFDASGGSDADGTIVNYHWDFGDTATADVAIQTTTHTYSGDGPYTVTLSVTDNDGGTGNVAHNVILSSIQSLLHDPAAGAVYEGYIASGQLRCARTLLQASFTTAGDVLVDTASGPHAAFLVQGQPCYIYGNGGNTYLKSSANSGGSFGVATLLATGYTPLGNFVFDAASGHAIGLVKQVSSGNTFRLIAHYNPATDTWTAEAPAAVSGMPANLSSAPVAGLHDLLFATVKSGSNINLYTSHDSLASVT